MVRKFNKKYKFEAQLPFEVKKSITLKNNNFLLQIKIKNLSVNKIFMDKVLFNVVNPQVMKVIDVNNQASGGASIFQDTIVFNPGELRQYLFIIAHV